MGTPVELDPIYHSTILARNGEYVPDALPNDSLLVTGTRELQSEDVKSWWCGIKEDLVVDRPEVEKAFDNLRKTLASYMSNNDIAEVEEAYHFAYFCHNFRPINPEDRLRKNKTDHYMIHPVEVAKILAGYKLRKVTIISALLHDIREDTYALPEEIYSLFGMRVGQNVEDLTKIRRNNRRETDDLQLYKLNSSVKDINDGGNPEAVLIKIADRLHNMRTLKHLDQKRAKDIARDTYQIYIPLADRLGLHTIAEELRHLALKQVSKHADKALLRKTEWNIRLSSHDFVNYIQTKLLKDSLHSTFHIENASIGDFLDFEGKKGNVLEQLETASLVLSYDNEEERDSWINFFQKSIVQSRKRSIQISEGKWEFTGFQFGDITWNIRLLSTKNYLLDQLSLTDRYRHEEKDPENVRLLLNEKLEDTREIIKRYESGDIESFRSALTERYPFEQIPVITPKGEKIWMNEGSTAADFAFEIHEDLLLRATGVRINEAEEVLPLGTYLKPGDRVDIQLDDTWEYIDPNMLISGDLTNPSAINFFKRKLSFIVDRKKSETNYDQVRLESGLDEHNLNKLGERIDTKLRHMALRNLENIYRNQLGKESEYDFSEVWDFLPYAFHKKFGTWDEFLYSFVLKDIQPRFVKQLFRAFEEYEAIQYDTGPIDVINQNGVIAYFSSTFEEHNIGVIQITREVNDARTPHGVATIRFLLDPKKLAREDVSAIVQTLLRKYDPTATAE